MNSNVKYSRMFSLGLQQKSNIFKKPDGVSLQSPCGNISTRWRQVGIFVLLISTLLVIYIILSPRTVVHNTTANPDQFFLQRRRHNETFHKNCTLNGREVDIEKLLESSQLNGYLQIPKILHRTWKSKNVPDKWRSSVDTCREVNPDHAFCLWTDDEIENFISVYFYWLLDTYKAYTYHIQRVDAVRYFILYRYGGVYLDLDLSCRYPFERMLSNYTGQILDVGLAETDPTGVTNAYIAARKGSEFMKELTLSLSSNNVWYVIPYATIMYSTGPMFVTKTYWRYESSYLQQQQHEQQLTMNQQQLDASQHIYVIPIEYYKHIYFEHLQGSSWHRWDAKIVKFLGRWLKVIKGLGIAAGVIVIVVIVLVLVKRLLLKGKNKLKTAPV